MRRIRDATELLAVVEPLEPHSTLIAGPLTTRGLSRHDRAWLVEGADGSPTAVVLVSRLCRDRWFAKPLLLREDAAQPLARSLDPIPQRQLAGVLARIFDSGMVVVGEEEGRLVAAMRAETRSRQYLYWGGLTVLPESRRHGLARAVIVRTHAATQAWGLGYIVVRATGRAPREDRRTAFNPLLQRPEHRSLGTSGTWMTVNLRTHVNERTFAQLRAAKLLRAWRGATP